MKQLLGLSKHCIHEGSDYWELETGSATLIFSAQLLMRHLGKYSFMAT